MKIWKGVEQELQMNYPTLFIQTPTLNTQQVRKILELSKTNKIKRLYFGAGKVEFLDFDRLKLLKIGNVYKNEFSVVIETAHPENVPKQYQIVYRVECTELQKNTILKVETPKTVSTIMFRNMFTIDLDHLNRETLMYREDELLWEDK